MIKESPTAANSGAQNLDVSGFNNHNTVQEILCQSLAARLSEEHLQELRASAITDEVIYDHDVRTAYELSDLPGKLPDMFEAAHLPALVYNMTEPDGSPTYQVKPKVPWVNSKGGEAKYVGPARGSGMASPKLPVVRAADANTQTLIICEGTKQALAVASYAPKDHAVYGIAGIWAWKDKDSGATPDLDVVQGRDVIIIPDADFTTNRMVYDGAAALGEQCKLLGAKSVGFVQVPGEDTQGVDDVLALRQPENRADALQHWLNGAKPLPKKAPKRKAESASTDKPVVRLDLDMEQVFDQLDSAVFAKFAGEEDRLPALYQRDKQFMWVDQIGDKVDITKANHGHMLRCVASSATLFKETQFGLTHAKPTKLELDAVMVGAVRYPELVGVSTIPVLHGDGTIATANGYDPESKMFVHLAPELEGLVISEHPSDEELRLAREWLDELLCDFLFKSDADRTRAIAALLTPFVRPIVPTSPLTVLNGLRPGIGKGYLLEQISLIMSGEPPTITLFIRGNELRKRLFAELMQGSTIINLDEARGDIFTEELNMFLTAPVWSDRKLGVSENPVLVNKACVYVTGNKLSASIDTGRRALFIDLHCDFDPALRRKEDFRHPDLSAWTLKHRRELVWSCFTIIRAWFDRGKPIVEDTEVQMNSFNAWQDIVEGSLSLIGLNNLMEGVLEQREANDEVLQQWLAHFEWLEGENINAKDFWATDVLKVAGNCKISHMPYELPPGITVDSTPTELSKLYATVDGIWKGDFKLDRLGRVHGARKFHLQVRPASPPPNGGGGGTTPPQGPVPSPPPIPGARPQPAAAPALPAGAQPAGHRPTVRDVNGNVCPAPSWLPASCVPVRPGPAQNDASLGISSPDWELFDAMAEGTDEAPVTFDDRTAQLEGSGVVDVNGTREGLDVLYFNLTPEGDAECRLGSDPCERISVPALVNAMQDADLIVGYDVFGETAQVLGDHGFDLAQAVNQNQVRDVLVMARQCDPPAQERDDSLGVLAKRYRLPADTDIDRIQSLFRYLPCDEYGLREHQALLRVGKAAAGEVCIDTAELEADIASFIDQRNHTVDWLETKYGVEAWTKDGKRSKAPWATEKGLARLVEVFNGFGIDVPLGTDGKPSLKREFLKQLADDEALSGEARELARRLARAKETLPAQDVKKHLSAAGTVRPRVKAEQAFGRLTTTDPALNTFGKRDPRLLGQRRVILPDSKDEVLIAFDFGQIDARMMAVGSQDEAYLANFAAGVDSHTALAEQLWGDPSRRPDAKKLAHAMNYGMGAQSLAKKLGWARADAQKLLDDIAQQYPKLHEFKQRLRTQATRHGYIETGFGRRLRVNKQNAYTQAPAAYGQGTARDILTEALIRMDLETVGRIKMFVHDEIVVSVPKDKADEYRNTVLQAMTFEFTPPTLLDASDSVVSVSVIADASNPGDNWAECYAD